MNGRRLAMFWAWGAGAVAIAAPATQADVDTLNLGTFANAGFAEINYEGDFGEYISVTGQLESDNDYNVITIDLASLLEDAGFNVVLTVTVVDTGLNQYNNSPGADIDLLSFQGLMEEVTVGFDYDGPVELHSNETSEQLAERLSNLDAENGVHNSEAPYMVSLGNQGSLTATLTGWPGIDPDTRGEVDPSDDTSNDDGDGEPDGNDGGGSDDGGGDSGDDGGDGDSGDDGGGDDDGGFDPSSLVVPTLLISEAGMAESFEVYITVESVPAPGALALLGMAGFAGRRSRRRRNA